MLSRYKFVIVYTIVFFLGLFSSYLFLISRSPKDVNKQSTTLNYNNIFDTVANVEQPKDNVFNVVLLGAGGSGHSGGGLTDSIIIVHIDPGNKKAGIISIPRDLYVPGNRKINAEVSVNGLDSIKGVLKGVTGLEINKYILIDFGSLIKMINLLGGIEVTVPRTFNDNFYPVKGLENELCSKSSEEVALLHQKYSGFELEKQFTCRYEQIHFDKGTTLVNGETALKFARSRHGDSDFGRSERQFAILIGIVNKLSTESPFKNIELAYESLSTLVKTDLSLNESTVLFNLFGNPDKYDVAQVYLTDQNVLVSGKSNVGEYILLPREGKNNFSGIKSFISSKL